MDKTISFGQALAHCAGTTSYWVGIIIVLLVIAAAITIVWRVQRKYEVNPYAKVIGAFVLAAALLVAILGRPANIAANTTQEQAARGVYIGY
jgi:heme/copper-type cytochrome/quinol oxidase subunit 2